MSHITGLLLIDAPASALNNAGKDTESQDKNAVAVKFLRTPSGRYPYVSAQAVRYWLRTTLAQSDGWSATPTFREAEIAYTAADPIMFAEDDLFGYMRAPASLESEEEARAAGLPPLEEEKRDGKTKPVTITRISPIRIGTLVATVPTTPTRDWGTMSRQQDHPVIHIHQFYRAHLKAPFSIDLTACGTFFVSRRVGYRNLDGHRVKRAKEADAQNVGVRGIDAWRLPVATRRARVGAVLKGLGKLEGGAKQTLHLTDTAPAALILAVCKSGNQPFMRVFQEGDEVTVFRDDVLEEALRVFADDLQSDLYIGWAKGFLDAERKKLDEIIANPVRLHGRTVHVGHPREISEAFAKMIQESDASAAWFD